MARKKINDFKGIKLLKRSSFGSELGIFSETFKTSWLSVNFVQDSISESFSLGTLRGMHFQQGEKAQAKLITVFKGSIQDFFVDLRKDSSSFLHYGSLKLSNENNKVLFLPRGFAHGFLSLEENTLVSYKLDNYYSKKYEYTLKWDDPDLNIKWPKGNKFFISKKDLCGLSLKELERNNVLE